LKTYTPFQIALRARQKQRFRNYDRIRKQFLKKRSDRDR